MSPVSTIISDLLNGVDRAGGHFVEVLYKRIGLYSENLFFAMLILYVVIWGYMQIFRPLDGHAAGCGLASWPRYVHLLDGDELGSLLGNDLRPRPGNPCGLGKSDRPDDFVDNRHTGFIGRRRACNVQRAL